MHRQTLSGYAGVAIVTALIATQGGCTSDQVALSDAPTTSTTILTGVASRGRMQSGTVTAYAVNANGTDGSPLATGQVGPDGTFALTLSPGLSGPIRVTVQGGSYTSELDGSTQDDDLQPDEPCG